MNPATASQQVQSTFPSDSLAADSLKSASPDTLPSGPVYLRPSTDQLLKLWVIQHQSQIWDQVEISDYRRPESNVYEFGNMFKSFDNANFNYPGLEMRESSIYIPQNVRDYTDYKMGRDRYLPIFNPVLIGFMLYHVSRYASQFFNSEADGIQRSGLPESEKKMLSLLEKEYPLDENGWYGIYISDPDNPSMTVEKFSETIRELSDRGLLKPRTFEDGTVKYYPVADSSYIRMQLKK
jgi:hypothetical protein